MGVLRQGCVVSDPDSRSEEAPRQSMHVGQGSSCNEHICYEPMNGEIMGCFSKVELEEANHFFIREHFTFKKKNLSLK